MQYMPYLIRFILAIMMLCGGILPRHVYGAQIRRLSCEKCGQIITPGSNYIKDSDNIIYCSDVCFRSSLPACSSCGEKTAEAIVVRGTTERIFCSRCASKPRCFCCTMPADCSKLADGRFICRECAKTAVTSDDRMRELAREVRTLMEEKLGVKTGHAINFKLVDLNTLGQKSQMENGATEFGTYLYEELTETTITTTKGFMGKVIGRNKDEKVTKVHTIYLLSSTPTDKLVEVIAHELAHDWQQENYPNIQNLKVQEGFAEYVASMINTLYGRDFMNKRIQENPSEIYGDGYKMVRNIAGKGSVALRDFLEQYNMKSGR